jgi:hypothetical protein
VSSFPISLPPLLLTAMPLDLNRPLPFDDKGISGAESSLVGGLPDLNLQPSLDLNLQPCPDLNLPPCTEEEGDVGNVELNDEENSATGTH